MAEQEISTHINKQTCVFKRGGKCVQHDVVGKKRVKSTRIWDKNKNGIFGWKTRTKTTYVCRFEGVATPNVCIDGTSDCQEGVAKSNSMSRGYGMETTMSNNTAQGGPTTDQLSGVVNSTRISGAGTTTAGSNKSEMHQISGVEKDLG